MPVPTFSSSGTRVTPVDRASWNIISLRTSTPLIAFGASSKILPTTVVSSAPLARITLMSEMAFSPLLNLIPIFGITPLALLILSRFFRGSELSIATTSAATTEVFSSVEPQVRSAEYSSVSIVLCSSCSSVFLPLIFSVIFPITRRKYLSMYSMNNDGFIIYSPFCFRR